ncbi:MAG TPA: YbhB/YbcL family Raf kinase inhibitor-like protein [Thermoanaerobaculia bacterium]|nr:YbhB/YbcL family Raf kinase inhibitor-like protein [Thermoanaerobaculia bacterium]
MRITSTAFADGESIPPKYTCDGHDLIPPLAFEEVPDAAVSLALVMDDPDAPGGTWDHWVVWNIPKEQRSIEEGKPPEGVVGRNSWGKNAWGGPCPPDRQHRYVFKLYALDSRLDLAGSAGKGDLERAMKGHILAEARFTGLYDRVSRSR